MAVSFLWNRRWVDHLPLLPFITSSTIVDTVLYKLKEERIINPSSESISSTPFFAFSPLLHSVVDGDRHHPWLWLLLWGVGGLHLYQLYNRFFGLLQQFLVPFIPHRLPSCHGASKKNICLPKFVSRAIDRSRGAKNGKRYGTKSRRVPRVVIANGDKPSNNNLEQAALRY